MTGAFALMALCVVAGWAVWLAGAGIALRGTIGARPRVPRCRRCGYPLPEGLPVTCPECGRVATTARELRTRRRRYRLAAAGLIVMFGGRSLWAIPQVHEHGWWRLVPSNVIVLATPLLTKAWLDESRGYECDHPAWPSRLMGDFFERGGEGRLWRAQTWLHAHLAGTTASALGVQITFNGEQLPTEAGSTWSVVPVADLVAHVRAALSAANRPEWVAYDEVPGIAWRANPDWWDNCGCAVVPLGQDLLIAAPPDVLANVRAMIAEFREALARGPGRRDALHATPLSVGVRTGPFEGEDRFWVCYNVSDVVAMSDRDHGGGRDGGLIERISELGNPDDWRPGRDGDLRTEGHLVAGVLSMHATPRVHAAVDDALAEMRKR